MNIEIQNTPQNIVSLVTPKLKLLPEFFSDIVPASASGEKVGFMNTVGLPLRFIDVATEIVAQQNLNGYDHPWASGGNGVQIWDEEWELGYYANGVKDVSSQNIRCKNPIPVLGNSTYYVKYPDTHGARIQTLDENGNFISDLGYKANATFTTPSNCRYIVFYTNAASAITTYNHNISINYPSTNHDYYPWANICPITGFTGANIRVNAIPAEQGGFTYPVAWSDEAGTVHGGEVNVTKGKLTVTHKCVDMGSLNWVAGASNTSGVYTMRASDIENEAKRPPTSGTVAEIVCSAYPVINSDQAYQKVMGISLTRLGIISAYDENYNGSTSPADFKTAMTGKQLMYALATPVEYDISPVTAIKMLNGQNFVWSNTGNISVVYYKKVGVNDNVQTLMRSSAPSLGMERQEVEDRPLDDIRLGDGLMREVREPIDELEPIEREEIEEEPAEITEEEPQDEEPVEEPQEEVNEDER